MHVAAAPAPQAPFFDARAGGHVITRHADVAALLASPRVRVPPLDLAARLERRLPGRFAALVEWGEGLLIHLDGPPHARARDRANLMVRHMRQDWPAPGIGGFAADMLAPHRGGRPFDGVRLAARFIDGQWARLLGLPAPELERLVAEAERFLLDSVEVAPLAEYDARNRRAAGLAEDIMAGLPEGACPWHGGGRLRLDAPVLLVILSVANATVKQMIGNVLHLLAGDPAAQDRLRRDPDRLAPFVEEALRLHGAVRYRDRIAGPEGLAEHGIAPGAPIRLWLDSAGRDPRAYADPDRFDPDRFAPGRAGPRPAPVLAFGGGPHLCVGRLLARAQIRGLVESLPDGFRLCPAGAPAPFAEPGFRGFHSLPLRLVPA